MVPIAAAKTAMEIMTIKMEENVVKEMDNANNDAFMSLACLGLG